MHLTLHKWGTLALGVTAFTKRGIRIKSLKFTDTLIFYNNKKKDTMIF